MPIREVSLHRAEPAVLAAGLQRLRTELGVPSAFPQPVLAEAQAVARTPRNAGTDRTDVEFVTLDPEGALDLDQAFHLSRTPSGYLIRYAIADVAAFVAPGGAIDAEAHARGLEPQRRDVGPASRGHQQMRARHEPPARLREAGRQAAEFSRVGGNAFAG